METMTGMPAPAPLAVHRSRKRIAPFTLFRPETVAEAVSILDTERGRTRVMAGGIDLVNELKHGASGGAIVHTGRISGLATIAMSGDQLRIGSGVTLATLLSAPLIREVLPDIATCLAPIANVRVRWKATVGGNLLARNPAYDLAPVLAALDARMVFAHEGREETELPVSALSGGTPGFLTSIRIDQPARRRVAYDRSLRPALSVAIGLCTAPDGALSGTGAAGCAYAPVAVAPLRFASTGAQSDLAAVAEGWAETLPAPDSGWAGTASYRARMCKVLGRRLLTTIGAPA